jgi:hypothetical protein
VRYAEDLVELAGVHAVLITCSTMNRAYTAVERALAPRGVPVAQIDRPMMKRAITQGGTVLVVATHGPTMESSQSLLRETAAGLARDVTYRGVTIEEAWQRLATGDVAGHNRALASAIRAAIRREGIGCVVLAQLSMTVFLLTYPDPVKEFGVPVLTSGQCGFEHMRTLLATLPSQSA